MTKKQKIDSLANAMTQSERNGNENDTYYHFTDEASEGLKALFFEHFEIRDVDYRIFSKACDIMSGLCDEDSDELDKAIVERVRDSASIYTSELLGYINVDNQEDVTKYIHECSCDIAQAAGYWFENRVEEACFIIKEWLETE